MSASNSIVAPYSRPLSSLLPRARTWTSVSLRKSRPRARVGVERADRPARRRTPRTAQKPVISRSSAPPGVTSAAAAGSAADRTKHGNSGQRRRAQNYVLQFHCPVSALPGCLVVVADRRPERLEDHRSAPCADDHSMTACFKPSRPWQSSSCGARAFQRMLSRSCHSHCGPHAGSTSAIRRRSPSRRSSFAAPSLGNAAASSRLPNPIALQDPRYLWLHCCGDLHGLSRAFPDQPVAPTLRDQPQAAALDPEGHLGPLDQAWQIVASSRARRKLAQSARHVLERLRLGQLLRQQARRSRPGAPAARRGRAAGSRGRGLPPPCARTRS